jgi:hypothetical protein
LRDFAAIGLLPDRKKTPRSLRAFPNPSGFLGISPGGKRPLGAAIEWQRFGRKYGICVAEKSPMRQNGEQKGGAVSRTKRMRPDLSGAAHNGAPHYGAFASMSFAPNARSQSEVIWARWRFDIGLLHLQVGHAPAGGSATNAAREVLPFTGNS